MRDGQLSKARLVLQTTKYELKNHITNNHLQKIPDNTLHMRPAAPPTLQCHATTPTTLLYYNPLVLLLPPYLGAQDSSASNTHTPQPSSSTHKPALAARKVPYLVADASVDLAAGESVQDAVRAHVQQTGGRFEARAAGLRQVRQRLLVSRLRTLYELHVSEGQHGGHHTEDIRL